MSDLEPHVPNPKRVAAGKRNYALRKGLTEAGRQKMRESALRNRPWEHSTGPRTPEGKLRAAQGAKKRQKGPHSVREVRADVAEIRALVQQLKQSRNAVQDMMAPAPG
jgi:hypothetical protein